MSVEIYQIDNPNVSEKQFITWLKKQPELIQKRGRSHPINYLFKIIKTGQLVSVHAYRSDGTLDVIVSSEHNTVAFDYITRGIKPDGLVAGYFNANEDLALAENIKPAVRALS